MNLGAIFSEKKKKNVFLRNKIGHSRIFLRIGVE